MTNKFSLLSPNDSQSGESGAQDQSFVRATGADRDKCNIGISRALLYKCKAEFGTMLDDFFRINTDEVVKNRTLWKIG